RDRGGLSGGKNRCVGVVGRRRSRGLGGERWARPPLPWGAAPGKPFRGPRHPPPGGPPRRGALQAAFGRPRLPSVPRAEGRQVGGAGPRGDPTRTPQGPQLRSIEVEERRGGANLRRR